MLVFGMNELEENWAAAMQAAELQARRSGNGDAFDYFRLKEINDAARRVGIEWLLNAFLEVATEANRRGFSLKIENSGENSEKKVDRHSFAVGAATMRGSLVRLTLGIRALTIEAGFPQLPQDGFVRGGGLACARVSHFGIAAANEDVLLVRSETGAPAWFVVKENNLRQPFDVSGLKHHFAVFIAQV